jgi:hypothetical protein
MQKEQNFPKPGSSQNHSISQDFLIPTYKENRQRALLEKRPQETMMVTITSVGEINQNL